MFSPVPAIFFLSLVLAGCLHVQAWTFIDVKDNRIIGVGPAGIWSVNTRGEIFYRKGTYNNFGNRGTAWQKIPGNLKQVDVGTDIVLGVNKNKIVYYRKGISSSNPTGTKWIRLCDKFPMKYVSVSPNNNIWAVGLHGKVYVRVGTGLEKVPWKGAGNYWKHFSEKRLKQISVGPSGVWGVDSQDRIFYRTGTFGDIGSGGRGWQAVDGRLKYISSTSKTVVGANSANQLFRREGISSSTPLGTTWTRLPANKSVIDALTSTLSARSGTVEAEEKDPRSK